MDVQILLELNPRLTNVRSLKLSDLRKILLNSSLSLRWRVLSPENYGNCYLYPGQGMVILVDSHSRKTWFHGNPIHNLHATALWRCRDGGFVYFDPAGAPVNTDVQLLVGRSGGSQLQYTQTRWQGYGAATCMYHVFSFMHFATTYLDIPAEFLFSMFNTFMGPHSDEKAVSIVEGIIKEAGLNIQYRDIDSASTIYSDYLKNESPPSTPDMVQILLGVLTPEQCQLLQKYNTITRK